MARYSFELSSQQLDDIATALREKADGDEAAANKVIHADPSEGRIPEGIERLVAAFRQQAARQRVLAGKFEKMDEYVDVRVTGEI